MLKSLKYDLPWKSSQQSYFHLRLMLHTVRERENENIPWEPPHCSPLAPLVNVVHPSGTTYFTASCNAGYEHKDVSFFFASQPSTDPLLQPACTTALLAATFMHAGPAKADLLCVLWAGGAD
eukprot:scaffold78028_cov20-Tisochrysis_lutea.AAC.2